MPLLTFRVELTLEGPVITRSSTAVTPGVDAPWLRDALGRHVLPGTLVAGRFADAIVDLVDIGVVNASVAQRYLGLSALHGPTPGRNRLVFEQGFYRANAGPPAVGVRRRIRIDPETGAAARGMLQVLETPFASGELVTFAGNVSVLAPEGAPDERPAIQELLDKGLRWAPSFGASRTIGFGRNRGVRVTALEPVPPATEPSLPLDAHGRAGLVLKLDQPFCLARPRRARNLFEADTVVSGAVVKGTLARMLDQLYPGVWSGPAPSGAPRELVEHFSRVRILHAFPVKAGATKRPVQPAASLVRDAKGKVWDVARAPGVAGLIHGDAPAFAIDWKDRGTVDAEHGWADPMREVRVRTAIDRATGRAADEKLFALELVWPFEVDQEGKRSAVEWVSGIDLSDVPAEGGVRARVSGQLAALLGIGLCGVGKTKARVTAASSASFPTIASRPGHDARTWTVTLQSPALLFDPADLPKDAGEQDLAHAYQRYWSEASTIPEGKPTLRCARYFASQHLAGGTVQALRSAPGTYRPWVLTGAGAVFILEPEPGQESKARSLIEQWERCGLPLPGTVRKALGLSGSEDDHAAWQKCPFVRQNGFGEIAVNHHLHTAPGHWVAIEPTR